jgi:hypothetical protein
LLLLFQQAYSQPDSVLTQPVIPGDSQQQQIASQLTDSIRIEAAASANYPAEERAVFFRRWKDQFPSPLIMRFNGLPETPAYELPVKKDDDDWKFWLSLFLLVLLAVIRYGYSKDFSDQMSAFRHWGVNQQALRELGTGVPFGVVLLNFFSALVFSFYAYSLIDRFGWVHIEPGWLLMLVTFFLVVALLLVRYLALKSAEVISSHGKELRLYTYYELELNRIAGLFLLPLILLIQFAQEPISAYAWYASYALLAAFFFMRVLKEFSLGFVYFGHRLIHFLLYICALEIAPLLILIRLLSDINPMRFSL